MPEMLNFGWGLFSMDSPGLSWLWFFFPVESLMEPVVKKKKGAEASFA